MTAEAGGTGGGGGAGGAGAGERYLRRLAEAELRRADGSAQVVAAAEVLVWAGALDRDTADAVLAGFITARELRSGGTARLARSFPRRPSPGAGPGAAPLTGPVRVVPIGAALPGRYQVLHVLALTLAPGQAAVLTVAGLIDPDHRPSGDDLPIGPYGPSGPDWGLTFTGDDGTRYPFTTIGGGTSDGVWWRQDLVLPAAAAEAVGGAGGGGWLEITAEEGPATIRVNVADGRGASDPEAAEAGEATDAEWLDAGWLLDNIAAGQLWRAVRAPAPGRPAAAGQIRLAAQAAAVQEVGLVPAGSPARRRYAELARRLAGTAAGAGAAGGGADDLPDAWADVLATPDLGSGREVTWAGGAVLPPLDRLQFAVTGIVSAAGSTTIQGLAWGPTPADAGQLTTVLFSWWARDDTGHWHVGRAVGGAPMGQPMIALDVVLVPPLDPAATALEVIVTGRGGRARATVALRGV